MASDVIGKGGGDRRESGSSNVHQPAWNCRRTGPGERRREEWRKSRGTLEWLLVGCEDDIASDAAQIILDLRALRAIAPDPIEAECNCAARNVLHERRCAIYDTPPAARAARDGAR